MMIRGQIKDFTIPEALKVIFEGQKSGLLSIRMTDALSGKSRKYYISIKKKAINGFCENLDGRDLLVWLSEQTDFLSAEQRKQLLRLKHDAVEHKNLGDYLIAHHYLSPGQLQIIFNLQVIEPIRKLFAIDNGLLTFLENAEMPEIGLTGLNLSIPALTLKGLNYLRDWSLYFDKLPEPQISLLRVNHQSFDDSNVLNDLEKRLLIVSDARFSLMQLAKQWNVDIKEIQKAAFSLVVTGMVEEIPLSSFGSKMYDSLDAIEARSASQGNSRVPFAAHLQTNGMAVSSSVTKLKEVMNTSDSRNFRSKSSLESSSDTSISSVFFDRFNKFISQHKSNIQSR